MRALISFVQSFPIVVGFRAPVGFSKKLLYCEQLRIYFDGDLLRIDFIEFSSSSVIFPFLVKFEANVVFDFLVTCFVIFSWSSSLLDFYFFPIVVNEVSIIVEELALDRSRFVLDVVVSDSGSISGVVGSHCRGYFAVFGNVTNLFYSGNRSECLWIVLLKFKIFVNPGFDKPARRKVIREAILIPIFSNSLIRVECEITGHTFDSINRLHLVIRDQYSNMCSPI